MRLILFLLLSLLIQSCTSAQTSSLFEPTEHERLVSRADSLAIETRWKTKAEAIKLFAKKNSSYNQQYAFLIDMRIPSSSYRFFVVELDSLKIVRRGLVAHGSGSETGIEDSLKFSNVPESYCSSIGKYKIGSSYVGSFGRSYKLHGLDKTNSNALARAIVLHRYSCVPDEEQISAICNSLGCPMLSENFFLEVDAWIRKSTKPVLLEIYY